jgi:hypothetical protein
MKIAARVLSLLVLMSVATFYISCDGGDDAEKSETDVQIEKLTGTWKATSVTYNSTTPPLDHSNFVITITGAPGSNSVSYAIAGRPQGPSAWPASGTLEFGSNVKSSLTREDATPVTYAVTATGLIMDFNFTGTPYSSAGRTKNVTGQWHFEFTKQ